MIEFKSLDQVKCLLKEYHGADLKLLMSDSLTVKTEELVKRHHVDGLFRQLPGEEMSPLLVMSAI